MDSDGDNCFKFEQSVVLYKNFPQLDELRREGKFCDVTIKVIGLNIRAHKIILSGTIPYFHAMFTSNMLESEMSEVILNEIDATSLEALINFSYTGKIVVDIETVQSLMFGASYLQLTEVLNACENFLCKRLKVHKVLGIRKFADALSCKALVDASQKFIEEHFNEVSSCEEFLNVTAEELECLLSNNQLNVSEEEQVFTALMRWIKRDPENRKKHLPQLLLKIRLPLVSAEYLVNNIAKEELIKSSSECRNLIDEVKDYHIIAKSCMIKRFKSEPRRCESLSGTIHVVGGLNPKLEAVATVESYSPSNCKWSLTAPMDYGRAKITVAVVKDHLYAIGGECASTPLADMDRFDFNTGKWYKSPSMDSNRSAGGAAVLEDLIYVCGGFDGNCSLDSVAYYDPESEIWERAEPMISRRSSCGVVALNGHIYALGGHDEETILDQVERYNPATGEWTEVAPMLTKRCRLGVASLKGKLYACGGYDGSSFLKTVEVYNPEDDEWQMIAPMDTKRSGLALAVNMGKLWAIGGFSGDCNVLSTVEIYNSSLDKWTYGPQMTEKRGDFGVGVIKYS